MSDAELLRIEEEVNAPWVDTEDLREAGRALIAEVKRLKGTVWRVEHHIRHAFPYDPEHHPRFSAYHNTVGDVVRLGPED